MRGLTAHRQAIACVAFIAILLIVLALTKEPWNDEATMTDNALSLIHNGHLGTHVIAPNGLWSRFPNLEQHTFWLLPFYLVSLAGWLKLVGAGLFAARMFTVLFGVLSLAVWYALVRTLGAGMRVAWVSLLILGCDVNFAMRASEIRMDTLCLFLLLTSYLVFFQLQDRSLLAAVFWSNCLAAGALLTHPNGAIGTLALWLMIVYAFRQKLSLRFWITLASGGIPHLIALATYYFLSISRAMAVWKAQLGSHATGRFDGLFHPLHAIVTEFTLRYGDAFSFGPTHPLSRRLFVVVFALYLGCAIAVLTVRSLRQDRLLQLMRIPFLCFFLYFTFFEAPKSYIYVNQIMPYYALFVAVCIDRFLLAGHGKLAAAILALAVLPNIAALTVRCYSNRYAREYVPAIAFIQKQTGGQGRMIAPAGFAFSLGFDRVVEDHRLENLVDPASNVRRDLIFTYAGTDKRFWGQPYRDLPGMAEKVAQELPHYRQVCSFGQYIGFARQPQ